MVRPVSYVYAGTVLAGLRSTSATVNGRIGPEPKPGIFLRPECQYVPKTMNNSVGAEAGKEMQASGACASLQD